VLRIIRSSKLRDLYVTGRVHVHAEKLCTPSYSYPSSTATPAVYYSPIITALRVPASFLCCFNGDGKGKPGSSSLLARYAGTHAQMLTSIMQVLRSPSRHTPILSSTAETRLVDLTQDANRPIVIVAAASCFTCGIVSLPG
jgi:hypothetical protein